jgi:nitrite reductase/ring-hydroxylating ferredoxin subunit
MAARSVMVPAPDLKPGDLGFVDVETTRIAVANVDGQLFAFDDVCTHEECSLSEGLLEGTVVTCPCHGAQFDVRTGEVVAPPAVTPVKTYPIRIQGAQLVLDL